MDLKFDDASMPEAVPVLQHCSYAPRYVQDRLGIDIAYAYRHTKECAPWTANNRAIWNTSNEKTADAPLNVLRVYDNDYSDVLSYRCIDWTRMVSTLRNGLYHLHLDTDFNHVTAIKDNATLRSGSIMAQRGTVLFLSLGQPCELRITIKNDEHHTYTLAPGDMFVLGSQINNKLLTYTLTPTDPNNNLCLVFRDIPNTISLVRALTKVVEQQETEKKRAKTNE